MDNPISLITDKSPACYGVECPVHQNCTRYYMVDGAGFGQTFIGHCLTNNGDRPLYLRVAKENAP